MTTTELAGTTPTGTPAARQRSGGNKLLRFLIVRFLLIFPTILILVTMVFVLMRTIGDPITAALGGRLPPEQLAQRMAALAGQD